MADFIDRTALSGTRTRTLVVVASLTALAGLASACATAGDGPTVDDVVVPAGDASPPPDHQDAGSAIDAGVWFDAGQPIDSGARLDAGTTPDTGADASTDTGASLDSGGVDAGGGDGGAACPQHGFSGALATFDLSAQPGNEASAVAASTASGVNAGPLTRSAAMAANAVTGSGSMNTSGWPAASTPDPLRYYTFTITAPSNCSVTLSALAIDDHSSASGPSAASLATSVDGFASRAAIVPNSAASIPIPAASNATGTIEVRIYGYGATSSGGTYRIQNTLTLSGALQ